MKQNKIIYSIDCKDVQTVASEEFGRKLTKKEVKFVEDRLGDYLDWYEVILASLKDLPQQGDPLLSNEPTK